MVYGQLNRLYCRNLSVKGALDFATILVFAAKISFPAQYAKSVSTTIDLSRDLRVAIVWIFDS